MMSHFVRRKVALAFYRFDLSKNGIVSRSDLQTLGERVAEELNVTNRTEHDRVVGAFINLWEAFGKAADSDGDHAISLEEYLAAHEKFLQMPQAKELGLGANTATFDALDLDGDGRISEKEYLAFICPQGVSRDDAREAFKRLDRNHDGQIARDEFASDWWEYWNSDDRAAAGNWFYGPY